MAKGGAITALRLYKLINNNMRGEVERRERYGIRF